MKTKKPKIFSKLTAAQKRVAIAKDVLKQIRRHTRIKSGKYWIIGTDVCKVTQEILQSKTLKCVCCAAGAVVISAIRLFNRDTINRLNSAEDSYARNRWFSLQQMALIETAFEVENRRLMEDYLSSDARRKAYAFNQGVRNPTERARRIFKNIIKNKGTFIP